MQKVIINPSYGGINSGKISGNFIEKKFNLELAKELQNKLNKLGITNYLIRENDNTISNEERINEINNLINTTDDAIVITFEIIDSSESGVLMVYPLKYDDELSRDISKYLEDIGLSVIKYYQLRNPNDTSLDYYEIIREISNGESIILSLGNPSNSFDNNYLLNNIDRIANSIANAISDYFTKQNIYIVQRGDTLFSIANKFNITVDALKKANNLTSNALIVGNELFIPNEVSNSSEDEEMDMYLNYKVVAGDSLYSIARKYETTVDVLKDINNLENTNLTIGQIIKIPTSTTSIDINYNNYTVVAGDSLYSIAKKFNTTINEIKDLNNLTTNTLSIGQVLKIPNIKGTNQQQENYSTYIVKAGDSLYKIASLYQTSVNNIKDLNNLTSNTLSIGQELKIPANSNQTPSNYKTYTVVSGDSLYRIANKFNTTVKEIKNLNNLTSNTLSIGQTLKIPN